MTGAMWERAIAAHTTNCVHDDCTPEAWQRAADGKLGTDVPTGCLLDVLARYTSEVDHVIGRLDAQVRSTQLRAGL